MQNDKYRLKRLLDNTQTEQILVPEIQRDYVWQVENVAALLRSIVEDWERNKELQVGIDEATLNLLPAAQRELMVRTIKENKPYANIGFIYAYADAEAPERYYLIDGQQRITTLFILLLALAIKEGKQSFFRNSYFKDNKPKVNYKVREACKDFLRAFIEYLLTNGKLAEIKHQSWYYSQYEDDATIQNLISNYEFLVEQTEHVNLDYDFVENQIELWYFNTNRSAQGEELYIFMNSRGESTQPYENIKAKLLEGLSNTDKHNWGTKWEEWQSFFWKNKGSRINSDSGLNEFFRWANILQVIQSSPGISRQELSSIVKSEAQSKKVEAVYVDVSFISEVIAALVRLSSCCPTPLFDKDWLSGEIKMAGYFRLLPLLHFCMQRPSASTLEITRLARYFYNLIRDENIRKSPDDFTAQSLLLVSTFCQSGLSDIAEIVSLNIQSKYERLLSSEEIFKFKLFKTKFDRYTREDVEQLIWSCEDYDLSSGSIGIVLDAMHLEMTDKGLASFSPANFSDHLTVFREIFYEPSDLLRRALLTYGDYSFRDGGSTTLELPKYNFGYDREDWKTICELSIGRVCVSNLITAVTMLKSSDSVINYASVMSQMIRKYIDNTIESDRLPIYPLIVSAEPLKYCGLKRVCIGTEDIYLLAGKTATSFKPLNEFI